MNKHHLRITLAAILTVIITGCNEQSKPKTLGEKEIYFNEKLSSVSPDGDSACWVGSETGDIWYISANERRTYNIGTDRIYKVVPDRTADGQQIFWLGIRNSGLQKWCVKDGQPIMMACYPIAAKGDQYSVYDILTDGDMIYAATSQGLYGMRRDGTSLTLLYPGATSATALRGQPMTVSCMCLYNGNLLAGSQDGLIRYNPHSRKVDVLHRGTPIHCVNSSDGLIYALTDGRLFIDSIATPSLREVPLTFPARHHRKIGGTHYFIESSHVVLSEDLQDFISVPLRHKVPLFSCNILCTGRRDGHSLLVTENALWHIPHHIGVFNVNGEIVASCADGDRMYFLNSSNELFCKQNEDATADKIYDLPETETINRIMACDGRLYCVSNGDRLLGLDVHDSYLRNGLFSTTETVFQAPTKITSACICRTDGGHRVYLGIQDELISIADDGRTDTVPALSGKYITAFHIPSTHAPVYLATLNDGVFCGSGKDFTPMDHTDNIPFIRDITVTGEHIPMLMMLTNHSLILPESRDTIEVKGFNKLLYVNDSLFYALPETGLCEYAVHDGHAELLGEYYGDIHFNPQASFVHGDRIYLGSDIGVLTIAAGNVSDARWVEFCPDAPNIRMLGVSLIFIILLTGVTVIAVKKRDDSRRRMIGIHISDLRNRLDSLTAIAAATGRDEDAASVKRLRDETETLNVKSRDAAQRIAGLSKSIMLKNRDMALALSKHLHSQTAAIEGYDAYDRARLLEESHTAQAVGDTERIIEQVSRNAEWLTYMATATDVVNNCRRDMAGTQEVDGVNAGLAAETERVAEALLNTPLDSLETDIRQLDMRYRFVFTDDAADRIDTFVRKRTELITDITPESYDDVAAALVVRLHEFRSAIRRRERIEILRRLRHANNRVCQILTRRQLAETMDEYRRVRQAVIDEQTGHTQPTAESSLEIEIADRTQPIAERIEALTKELYALIAETDPDVLTNMLRMTDLTKQSARIMALLIARPSTERDLLAGMLGMFGNMAPVISRLKKNKIKPAREQLAAYAKAHPDSMVPYILALV